MLNHLLLSCRSDELTLHLLLLRLLLCCHHLLSLSHQLLLLLSSQLGLTVPLQLLYKDRPLLRVHILKLLPLLLSQLYGVTL